MTTLLNKDNKKGLKITHFYQALAGIGGLVLLYYGAEFLVRGGVAIARRCGVPPLVIGLTLVAFATSAPEFVVSLDAALNNMGDMSVGNVVGSNTCNIALILGLCAMISPLSVNKKLFSFDIPAMLISAVLLAGMCYFWGGVNRFSAAVLFAGIIFYTIYSIRKSRNSGDVPEEVIGEVNANLGIDQAKPEGMKLIPAILLAAVGIAALIAGGKLLLMSAVYFAGLMGVSEAVIALTVVAVGTSLPELATSVVAAIKKEQDIAIGNVVGSNIFNILGILGFSGLINPIKAPGISPVDLGMMLLCSFILYPIMRSGWKISRIEGTIMLLMYIGYTAYLIVY